MADIEFGQLRDRGDGDDIVIGQAVAGMGFDPVPGSERGAVGDSLQFGHSVVSRRMGIAAGVELDHRCAEAQGRVDLALAGFDEQADPNPGLAQPVDERAQGLELAGRVEPALGGALLALLRDDAGGVGAVGERDAEHFLGRCHLEVQRQTDFRHQPVDIGIGDVAPVFAQVSGDPIRAGFGGHDRRPHRIGKIAATRVPDGRDMVDIDAQPERLGAGGIDQAAARLPGLIAGIAASSGGSESAS